MAKTRDNEQLYYYFKMNLLTGKPVSIKVTHIDINTVINKIYVEMTEEQNEFYLEHPDASVMEVWNCEIVPPYVPPTPDVQEYASEKVKELKDACYNAVTITSLEFSMAIDKVENPTASCYYNITEANRVVTNFRSQSKAAMTVFDTYSPQISEASTIEAIDTLYETAIEALQS